MDLRRARIPAAAVAFVLACAARPGGAATTTEPAREVLIGYSAAMVPGAGATPIPGATLLKRIPGINVDLVRTALPLDRLERIPGVAFAEPNAHGRLALGTSNDPADKGSTAWRARRMNLSAAWSLWPGTYYTASSKPRSAVKVAVLDGRVQTDHPDFVNARGSSTDARSGGQISMPGGRDIVPPSEQTGSFDWHGTFIAGLVGAAANNKIGIAGVGYGARIVPIVVATGEGLVTADRAADGILAAVGAGAKVINLSFAIGGSAETLRRAVDVAASSGAVMVAAAGNNTGSATMYPAAFARDTKAVIAVSATDPLDKVAFCSNHNTYVTLAAPATDVVSLNSNGSTRTAACGTSAAAATVSGTAAMIAAKFPGISPASIRARLTKGADDVMTSGHDRYTGAGRLNAQRALWPGGGPRTTASRPRSAGTSNRTTLYATAKASAGIAAAEYFVGSLGARGTGRKLAAGDGRFGEDTETLKATVSTSRLAEGPHEIYVRARDGRGNWGPAAVATLVVDRTAPVVTEVAADPAVVMPRDPRGAFEMRIVDTLSRSLSVKIEFIDAQDVVVASHRYTIPAGLYRVAWRGTMDPPGSTTHTKAPMPPGAYTIRVTAVDEAGGRGIGEGACVIAPASPT